VLLAIERLEKRRCRVLATLLLTAVPTSVLLSVHSAPHTRVAFFGVGPLTLV
jgi:hypothetical protein